MLKDSLSKEIAQKLLNDCKEILNRMRDDKNLTEQEYTDTVDAFRKVSAHLLRKHKRIKEEVNRIMGGEIYVTASEKLINKGKKLGKAEGVAEANVNAIEQMAKYFVENKQAETIEDGKELAKKILKL